MMTKTNNTNGINGYLFHPSHTLRHTAVTLLQQAGATGAEAKAFAGHGSVGMTERYTHAEVERMRGSVEAIRFGETKVRRVM